MLIMSQDTSAPDRLPDAMTEHDVPGLVTGALDRPSEADLRQDMLSEELHHRVQNTLAIVLALARITARSCRTIDEFQVAFSERVQAMGRTNALLLRHNMQAVDLRAALEVELEPYSARDGQVTLHCEPINITADAALSLSLMIHELATNAAKYGGLSTPDGTLNIRCEKTSTGGMLTWRETVPGMTPRERRTGAGTVLIARLAEDLGGEAVLDLTPTGLEAVITFKVRSSSRP